MPVVKEKIKCAVCSGESELPYAKSGYRLMECKNRASSPWRVLHFGVMQARVTKLMRDSVGYMTRPGNYIMTQAVPIEDSIYPRGTTMSNAFKLLKEKWPDFVIIDTPGTFGYVERFFVEESWSRIKTLIGDIPVILFDNTDRGDYSKLPPDYPVYQMAKMIFKREVARGQIENYPKKLKKPLNTWLGPSCPIFEPVPWSEREWDIFLWCSDTSKLRADIMKAFQQSEYWNSPKCVFYLENTCVNPTAKELMVKHGVKSLQGIAYPNLPPALFGRIMANTKIVLAPDGYGPFTHRHVEGVLSGAFVVSSDMLKLVNVPLKNAYYYVERADDWPIACFDILENMKEKEVVNRTRETSYDALDWFSVPSFATYLKEQIALGLGLSERS